VPDGVAGTNDEPRDLGALLALLHRADLPFETVAASYRLWVNSERSGVAMRAQMEVEKRPDLSVSRVQSSRRSTAATQDRDRDRDEETKEREEIVRI
jgi:hypothetical protein